MDMNAHFSNFAAYNQWANNRLYTAAAELNKAEIEKNLDGFFSSLFHTLNHILVGDLLWMERLEGAGPKPDSLDTVLASDMDQLMVLRRQADKRLITLIDDLKEEQLSVFLDYKTSAGIACHDRISEIMTHLFNHQTHHRGQCHHMLSQLGKSPPPLDMIYFIRERDAAV
jgi:uncharacterized damage-inducible protein DinB